MFLYCGEMGRLLGWWLACCVAAGAQVTGRVVDAVTGEPLGRVLVRNLATRAVAETGPDGVFHLPEAASGEELAVSSVGYRPFRFRLEGPAGREWEIRLTPGTLRQTAQVDVQAGPFAVEESASAALSLAGNELRNLASVLADDPLRAVQGLPGVNPNDDFQSQLSLRGASFHRIGVYLDGVLLHSPYHTLQADPTSASLSSDMLESAVLHAGAPPPEFADRTVAALDLRLRDGNRQRFIGRAAASASNASISLEGPFARRRGSWLVSTRKSYLQYLIQASSDEPFIGFGFTDVQGRTSFDVTPRHQVALSLAHGSSGLDRSGAERTLGINAFFESDYQFTLASLHSRATPAASLALNHTVSWMRERYENRNRERNPLGGGYYGEWIANASHTWQWREQALLLFGGTLRRVRDDGYQDRRLAAPPFVSRLDAWRGHGVRAGTHLTQQVSLGGGKVLLRGGGRWDTHDTTGQAAWSPAASVSAYLTPRTQAHLAWGTYAQYPEPAQLFSRFGRTALLAERANQVQLGLEQRLGERTRVRVEAYQRLDRDLLFRPLLEPRLLAGRIYAGNLQAPWENSLRGASRGWQAFVQRRSSNGLTGWLSYAYSRTRMRDGVASLRFPADFDQRHTANLFLSYRLRPTVNVSGRWIYGSGFPVRAFLEGRDPFLLAAERNQVRLPVYHRLDLRANKTFVRRAGWHVTLFVEVINVYGRENVRFDELRGFDARTGVARPGFDKLFPVLPSAGMAIEF